MSKKETQSSWLNLEVFWVHARHFGRGKGAVVLIASALALSVECSKDTITMNLSRTRMESGLYVSKIFVTIVNTWCRIGKTTSIN